MNSITFVELYYLDAVGSLHQAAVEHSAERAALGYHGLRGAAHYVPVGELTVRIVDERKPGIGAHSSGVGALVAVERALVVLGERHGIDARAVDEAHERELGAGEEVLDYDLALAEPALEQHHLQGLFGLGLVLGYHDTLSGGEPVILEHGGERTRLHIVKGLPIVGEAAVGACP